MLPEYILKIDGMRAQGQVSNQPDGLELDSYHFGSYLNGPGYAPGHDFANPGDEIALFITTRTSAYFQSLHHACKSGEHFGRGRLLRIDQIQGRQPIREVATLFDIRVTSLTGDADPYFAVTFEYGHAHIDQQYRRLEPKWFTVSPTMASIIELFMLQSKLPPYFRV